MRLRTLLAVVVLAVPTLAPSAMAQPKPADPPKPGQPAPAGAPAPAGTTAPAEDEAPVPDDFKVNDDPNAPDAATTHLDDDPVEVKAKAWVRPTKETYPIEAIERPLTLTEGQAEVLLDLPFFSYGTVDEAGMEATGRAFSQVLRAAYGVTQDMQVGLTYNFGLEQVSPDSRYEPGKAFSLDGGYTIVPNWLALQVSLPFYVDPFAMSLTLGLPFRLRVHEKIAIIGGDDLLQIKLSKFPVSATDPAFNVVTLEELGMSVQAPDGSFNLKVGALWQAKPNFAASLMLGYFLPDFEQEDAPVPMWIDLRYSSSAAFDFGGRIGTGSLDAFGDRFFLGIYTAYRI